MKHVFAVLILLLLHFDNILCESILDNTLSLDKKLVFTNHIRKSNRYNYKTIFVKAMLKKNGQIYWKPTSFPTHSYYLMVTPEFRVWKETNTESFLHQFRNSLENLSSNYKNLSGLILDAEMSPIQTKKEYSKFICSLFTEIKNFNSLWMFSIAIFPPDHPDQNGYYDLQKLFVCSDNWIIMFYDEHSPRTAEGPVSSSNWIHTNLKSIETQLMQFEPNKTIHTQSIPDQQKPKAKDEKLNPSHPFSIEAIRKKIYLGLPLYGYAKLKSGKFGKVVPIQHWMHLPEFQNAKTDYVKFNHLGEVHYLPTLNFLRTWEQKCIQGGYAGVAYWREEFGSTYLDH
ncbi:glycosyl hydrolase family 18 protein [Leptospira jelokensis]|uniref:Glycosyl hydrolase n=1 Tax=Leptospira jelokensis TaxID=2484931 RepID=A0A4Z0ZWQ7_9LEPT|nr:glycosyl hydrolase family 18 protein [Leptospira jelokensis]TGL75073.1 glycosyl hydrolase [Leptospira jelokensis]